MADFETGIREYQESATRDLGEFFTRAKGLDDAVRKKIISVTSDDKGVEVKINGHAHVTDLAITDAAMRRPELLGRRISQALTRAYKTARTFNARAREKYLPEVPGREELLNPRRRAASVDFHQIDYTGPYEAKNALAEAMESMAKIQNMDSELANRTARCALSSGIGFLESSADLNQVRAVVDANAVTTMRPSRLQDHVLEALHEIERQAAEIKREYLTSIRIGSTSLNDILTSSQEVTQKSSAGTPNLPNS